MHLGHRIQKPEDYIIEIDRLLMFVGRYANQDAIAMQSKITMATLRSWAERTNELLKRENERDPEG